jgi:subtilisin family serine protease
MATDEDDRRPSFSNYGVLTVHLAAPGVDILSTHSYRWDTQGTFHPTKYRAYTGTSPAAAHVSGAAALLRALKPGWAPADVRAHLVASADPVSWVTCVAHGRLNLQRAVCGPITVTGPSSGDTWAKNTLVKIEWHLDYNNTPAVKTVSIWLHGPLPTTLLAAAVPIPITGNTGSCSAWAPNVTVSNVHLRIVSDQASFIYAESAGFSIT